jgi:hypothetical protein
MYKFGNSFEELSIRKIESGIRAIKNGSKTPAEANCGLYLKKLKDINEGMYQELLNNYIEVKRQYDNK